MSEPLGIEALGWISQGLFSACAIPQAWQVYKQGHAQGLNKVFLLMWFFGELGSIIFAAIKGLPIQLMANYVFNMLLLMIILRYKMWERK